MDFLTAIIFGALTGMFLVTWMRSTHAFLTLPEVPWKPVPWTGLHVGLILLVYGCSIFALGAILSIGGFLPPKPTDAEWLECIVTQQQVEQAGAGGVGPVVGFNHEVQAQLASEARTAGIHGLPQLLALDTLMKILMLAGVVVFLRWLSGATWAELGWQPQRWRSDVQEGWTAFTAIVPPVIVMLMVLKLAFPEEVIEHPLITLLRSDPPAIVWLVCGISAVIIAPLFEEFMFRRVMQGWLERLEMRVAPLGLLRGRPGWIPILLTSGVFAAVHSSWPDPIPLFALSVGLGHLMRRTQSLLPSMVVHATLNGFTFFFIALIALAGE